MDNKIYFRITETEKDYGHGPYIKKDYKTYTLIDGDERLDLIHESLKKKIIPLPLSREKSYFYFDRNSKSYIYIDHTKYNFSYETMRLFIQENNKISQIPIDNFARYRDGGTTVINSKIGTLYFPAALCKPDINTGVLTEGTITDLKILKEIEHNLFKEDDAGKLKMIQMSIKQEFGDD